MEADGSIKESHIPPQEKPLEKQMEADGSIKESHIPQEEPLEKQMEADGSIKESEIQQENQREVSPSLLYDAQPWGRPGFPSHPPTPEAPNMDEARWVN